MTLVALVVKFSQSDDGSNIKLFIDDGTLSDPLVVYVFERDRTQFEAAKEFSKTEAS